jgi:hypothetical protein
MSSEERQLGHGITGWLLSPFAMGQLQQIRERGIFGRAVRARLQVKGNRTPPLCEPSPLHFCTEIVRQEILTFLAGQRILLVDGQCPNEMPYLALTMGTLPYVSDSRIGFGTI